MLARYRLRPAPVAILAPLAILALAALSGARAQAADALVVQGAWAPPVAAGASTPLALSIDNPGDADTLLRTRCDDTAAFTEAHAVDHGEGFPSMRIVKSIPVAAHGVTTLDPDGSHVMLLQVMHPLAAGETFQCSLSFRAAGKREVEVRVGRPE